MDVQSRFRASRQVPYTKEFLILDPSDDLVDVLEIHLGPSALRRVGPGGAELPVHVFRVEESVRSDRVFQGHRELRVRGFWERHTRMFPAGALRITANPLVAHLLHPESDDSLTTWNFFDDVLLSEAAVEEADGTESSDRSLPPKVLRTHPVHMLE